MSGCVSSSAASSPHLVSSLLQDDRSGVLHPVPGSVPVPAEPAGGGGGLGGEVSVPTLHSLGPGRGISRSPDAIRP